ncbi:helicase SNF2 [Sporanaerobium hydrogeniformans]|uniref:Helicase SNF2 n=2 Tax=Sporanaerobium hydrogeniformans TaxID=3072179 RepID=A0AC61DI60_9FIRM|nr:helicase SNF2 [Sporanaerobium hydrogeniformans]
MALLNDGFGILFDMGLGKSLTTIAIMGTRYIRGEIDKVLIIAPSSVCPVWPKELSQFADFPYNIQYLSGTRDKRLEKLNSLDIGFFSGLKIAVINYESAWRLEKELVAFKPDMIVCDESQRIKNAQAQQSKGIHKLGDKAKYRIILTGTPVQNNPLDFFSQYRFLNKNIFGTSYVAFRNRYAQFGGYENHEIIGYRNLPELVEKAHSIAYRVCKEEALDLPEQVFIKRYCEFSNEERRAYEQLKKESITAIENDQMTGEVVATNVLTRILRLQQLTGGFAQLEDEDKVKQLGNSKLKVLEEVIEDVVLDSGRKLVIFAKFVHEIKAIVKMIQDKGIDYSLIYGEIKDRGEQVRRFQEEASVKIFIAQIQTAGLGITLTAADTAVYYSLGYNYADYAQSLARTHRIGQKNTCTYIQLIVPNTIDEQIYTALQAKEDIAKKVVDNWRDLLS